MYHCKICGRVFDDIPETAEILAGLSRSRKMVRLENGEVHDLVVVRKRKRTEDTRVESTPTQPLAEAQAEAISAPVGPPTSDNPRRGRVSSRRVHRVQTETMRDAFEKLFQPEPEDDWEHGDSQLKF